MRKPVASLILVLVIAHASCAGAVQFKRQPIRFPADTGWWVMSFFSDIDNDKLADMLILLGLDNKLLLYRQRKSGFAATPDQTVELPPHTAWIAWRDVDAHPGDELLVSTARGLAYFRQERGVFESQPQTLIEADQVFASDHPAFLAVGPERQDANDVIPVISADHAVLYGRDRDYVWSVQQKMGLHPVRTRWGVDDGGWTVGPNPARSLYVRTYLRANPEDSPTDEEEPENAGIQKLIQEIQESGRWYEHGVERRDINGDGREDLVLWRSAGELEPKTNVLVFLRGQDGRLPDKPTQILRGRGLAIRAGPSRDVSPIADLDGDGICEVVLVALKTTLTSWSSLVDMLVSRGVDWVFTVRSFRKDGYSRGPDGRIDMTTMLPVNEKVPDLFLLDGDFNGDGRRDILVKRSLNRLDVFLSTARAGWFESEPALTFQTPVEARLDMTDLNRDGLSDLCAQEIDEARIVIFLSQSQNEKGTQ